MSMIQGSNSTLAPSTVLGSYLSIHVLGLKTALVFSVIEKVTVACFFLHLGIFPLESDELPQMASGSRKVAVKVKKKS